MRRGAAHPTLPVDPAAAPAFARVERGPRGLRLAPAAPPDGAAEAPGPSLRLSAAAPTGVREAVVVAGGRLVLARGAGAAYSIALPQVRVVHDRRPPGLDRVAGAAGANAGLLHADDGWRAVVLPSLGDLVPALGPGPVAIRADGRAIAAAEDGAVVEWAVGQEEPAARHEGRVGALCYTADGGIAAAVGARLGAAGDAPAPGSPIVALAAAQAVPRVAARHADGTVSLWQPGAAEPLARWPSPVPGEPSIALSPDGDLVALGDPDGAAPAAVLLRAENGVPVRRVEGARAIALAPDGAGLVVGGDWGCAWLTPLEEDDP
jgi:hypothetical protein